MATRLDDDVSSVTAARQLAASLPGNPDATAILGRAQGLPIWDKPRQMHRVHWYTSRPRWIPGVGAGCTAGGCGQPV